MTKVMDVFLETERLYLRRFTMDDVDLLFELDNDPEVNKPVNGLVPTAANNGYWLVASDGGVFAFNAPFRGSMEARASTNR